MEQSKQTRAVSDLFDQQKLILIVPTIVICELAASDKQITADDFSRLLLRSNIEQADITLPIAIAAGELRKAVRSDTSTDGKKNLKTPDAIIVAAANHLRADFLISGDAHMLRMDGKYGIRCKICPPASFVQQPELPNFS